MRRSLLVAWSLGTLLTATPALAASGPVAVDDQAEAGSDTIHIYVLDNDTDPDDDLDPTSLALLTGPSKGSAAVISTGRPRIKYSRGPGETGEDRFSYQVCDTTDLCATATVTITIIGTTTTTTSTTTSTTTTTTTPTTTTTTIPGAGTTDTTSPPESPTTSTTTTANASPVPQTTTTSPRTDAVGQAVLSSPTTDTARFGNGPSVGLAAAMATLWETGAETVRIAAVPAVMGVGIAGFLASGLPKDIAAGILGWLAGLRRRKREEQTLQDHDRE